MNKTSYFIFERVQLSILAERFGIFIVKKCNIRDWFQYATSHHCKLGSVGRGVSRRDGQLGTAHSWPRMAVRYARIISQGMVHFNKYMFFIYKHTEPDFW